MGRRAKQVIEDRTDNDNVIYEKLYVYDGYQLIAQYNVNGSTVTPDRSYYWGFDISGTRGGAGGIGGLQLIHEHSNDKRYIPGYDAQGNVLLLYGVDDAHIIAEYEYDPFGNLVRENGWKYESSTWTRTGNDPIDNPFRWQTKWLLNEQIADDTYGSFMLYDFGFRFYHPRLGRFVNRDPIAEKGGNNLYAYVGNDPLNSWDYLGLAIETEVTENGMSGHYDVIFSDQFTNDEISQIINSMNNYWNIQSGDLYLRFTFRSTNNVFTDAIKIGWGSGTNGLHVGDNILIPREVRGHFDVIFRIVNHEFGHEIKLTDIYDSNRSNELMYGYYSMDSNLTEEGLITENDILTVISENTSLWNQFINLFKGIFGSSNNNIKRDGERSNKPFIPKYTDLRSHYYGTVNGKFEIRLNEVMDRANPLYYGLKWRFTYLDGMKENGTLDKVGLEATLRWIKFYNENSKE